MQFLKIADGLLCGKVTGKQARTIPLCLSTSKNTIVERWLTENELKKNTLACGLSKMEWM